jgi:RNA recognition motif-containing protein
MSRIFVGNIPFDATEEELRTLFKELGKIKQVLIPKDRETGKSRGFAFVEFEDSSQMMEAIERFNNATFKERKITVSEAKKRDASASSSRQRTQSKSHSAVEPTVTWEEEETEQVREKRYKKDVDFEASSKAKKRMIAEMEERKSKIIRDKGGKFIGLDDEEEDEDDFVPVYMKEPSSDKGE